MATYNIIILTVIAIYIMVLIRKHLKHNREITTVSGILFSVLLYMCLVPIIVVLFGDELTYREKFSFLSSSFEKFAYFYFSLLLFVTILDISYSKFNSLNYEFNSYYYKKYAKIFSYLTLYIGGISFIIYAHSFGGFKNLLLYAEMMRSFATDKAELFQGRTYILVVPSRMIVVAPILLLVYRNYTDKKLLNTMYIIVSLVLASLFFLSNAGKTGLLLFGLCFLVTILSYHVKHKWITTILIAFLGIEIIGILDALFVYLASGQFEVEAGSGSLSYLSQFSYPIKNMLNLQDLSNFRGYRFFQDYITGILNLVPGINFEPSYVVTSEYYSGLDWKIIGGTPNDAITFGHLQLGIVGVAVHAAIIGIICKRIDSILFKLEDCFSSRLLKCTLVIFYYSMFVNADVISVVRNQPTITLLSLLALLSFKKETKITT